MSVSDGSIKIVKSLGWRSPQDPSLSADGRYIAYSALATNPSKTPPASTDSTERHIYSLSADGTNETELVKTASINERPVWMPDGAHVVFTSQLTGTTDLWAVAVQNGKAAGSPPSLARREIGTISKIGMTLSGSFYYAQRKDGVEQVSVADLSAGVGIRILDSFVGLNPSWSPDGKSLAFKRHSTQFKDFFDLVVRSVETGEERIFSRDGIRGDPPRWLHGSQSFLTLVGPDLSTFSWNFVDLTSGDFTRAVQRGLFRTGVAALSPDDKVLYVGESDSNSKSNALDRVVAIDLATGQERPVFMFSGSVETRPRPAGFAIALSPNGRTLVMATVNPKNQEMRLALVDVDGRNCRELDGNYRSSATNGLNDKLAWTRDGRSILFATRGEDSNNNLQIMRIGIEGGKAEFTGLRVSGLSTFDLSPDGSRIAFSTTAGGTSTKELLAIDNLTALLKDTR